MYDKEYAKRYYQEHKEKIKARKKERDIENKDKIKEYKKSRKEITKEQNRLYYQEHKASIKERRKERYNSDNEYKMSRWCRREVGRCLKYIDRDEHTFDILGYTPTELKARIESQFKEGMTWDNYGEWHIDHRKPLVMFKFMNDDGSINYEQVKLANMLCNLKPLWKQENLSKGGTIE